MRVNEMIQMVIWAGSAAVVYRSRMPCPFPFTIVINGVAIMATKTQPRESDLRLQLDDPHLLLLSA